MSTMISDTGKGLRARRAATRYNTSTMASAPCPYFVKFGYCRAHTKEAEVRAKVVAAKEAEILKEACGVVDEFLAATAEAAAAEGNVVDPSITKTTREEYLVKVVRDLKKEKKHADWNMEHAAMDEMRRQKLHHCPFAHHRELLRDMKGMKLHEGATKEERLLLHRSMTAFTSLNSNDDLLHATLEHILSFEKGFEVPEDILLSLEQKKDDEDEDEEGEEKDDDAPLDMDNFVAPMIKLRAPIKFIEKSAFLDNSGNNAQHQQLVVPISLNIAHLPALVEYFAPQVLARHNEKKRAKMSAAAAAEKNKKNNGKDAKGTNKNAADAAEPPLFVLPQFVVTAKQINFSDAFFVQNFFALVGHVARTRWAKEAHFRAENLPAGLATYASAAESDMTSRVEEIVDGGKNKKDTAPSSVTTTLLFPFRVISMQYCDMMNAEEFFNAIRKDAFHRTNLRVVDLSHNKLDSLKFLFQLRAFFSTTSSAATNTTTVANTNGGSAASPVASLSAGGRIVSMWLAHNPITRKPEYRQQIRQTLPTLLMLDGTRLRKLPLALPFPTVASRWNFPIHRKTQAQQSRKLFGAYGPFFDPIVKSADEMTAEEAEDLKLAEEELSEEDKARNERLKKAWADVFDKIAKTKKEMEISAEDNNGGVAAAAAAAAEKKSGKKSKEAAATAVPAAPAAPARANPRYQIASGKEFESVTSFIYRYLFYWEKGEVPFSLFQHQHLVNMSGSLQQLVEEEADREHALATNATGKKKKTKKEKELERKKKAEAGGGNSSKKDDDDDEDDNAKAPATAAGKDEDEDADLVTETEELKRLQYARRLAILSAGDRPNVDEMVKDGLVSHLDTELYSLDGFRRDSEEVAIFAKYLNMIPATTLEEIRQKEKEKNDNPTATSSSTSLLKRQKSTPMANIVDITYDNFAAKFLHPSATVSVTVSPSCTWFDNTKMFNKTEVTTSHNRLNVLDAKMLWRLTGESAALRSYFFTPPPPPANAPLVTQNGEFSADCPNDDSVSEGDDADDDYVPSSSDDDDVGQKTVSLQTRLSTYQVEFAKARLKKNGRGGKNRTQRRGGAVDNQAARGKLVLKSANSANDQPSGIAPSYVAGSKGGGYVPGHKSATSGSGMTVSRDFLRQIMLLSPMDIQDLRLLDTAVKSHSRNLVDSIHQEVRHRIARGPMNAFNLYRSTVYPLGAINSALQSSGAVAATDAITATAGKKIRAHLMEKARIPKGRSGGITVQHHLQHTPTMSVQVVTDQIYENKQIAKAEAAAAKAKAAAAAAATPTPFGGVSAFGSDSSAAPAFGNLQKEPFSGGDDAAANASAAPTATISDEEIDALRYNSKGAKISDTALKIKVMLALREKQKVLDAEFEASKPAVVFQNVADPKDRKRSRAMALEAEKAAAEAKLNKNKKGGADANNTPLPKITAELNQQLFGVPLQEQSKPVFYLVTLHGTMTWRTPTMASQPLLPGADIEDVLGYNGQYNSHNTVSGQRPTDVLSFAFPNGISCYCDRTLTVTAQRVEVALPLKPADLRDLDLEEEEGAAAADGKKKKLRTIQHIPPFIAALARERLTALGYVDCPADVPYHNDEDEDGEDKKNKKGGGNKNKAARAELEGGASAPVFSSFGPMPQEYLNVYVRKLFIYNDHMNLRPAGANNGFVTAAAVGSNGASGSGRYQSGDRRNVSDQSGNVVYSHLRVDKLDELELEHCGDVGSSDDEEEESQTTTTDKKKGDAKKKDGSSSSSSSISSRQFIQQVLERSESDRAVYEALKEAFGSHANKKNAAEPVVTPATAAGKKGAAAAAPAQSKPVPFDTTGVQQMLRRHSSISSVNPSQ